VRREDHLAFPLLRKNYDELRQLTLIPRLLVVLLLPEKLEHWLEQSEEQLVSRHCAYWTSLLESPQRDTRSITVKLPRPQLFSAENLTNLMERTFRKERL